MKKFITRHLHVGLTSGQREELVDYVSKMANIAKEAHKKWEEEMKIKKHDFAGGIVFLQEMRKQGKINFTCCYTCFKDPVVYYTYTLGLFNIRFYDLVHLLKCTDENLESECKKVEVRILDLYTEISTFGVFGWQDYDSGGYHPSIYEDWYLPKKNHIEKNLWYSGEPDYEC